MPFVASLIHPIIDAQDALKYILDALPEFDDVDIRDGGPTESEDITFDMFWLNDVTVPRDGWAALGAQRRRITFNIGFTIAARLYGDEERAARARVLGYFEAFSLALKANPSLDGTVQKIDDVTGTLGSAPVSPNQWGAWFTGSLSCTSKAY